MTETSTTFIRHSFVSGDATPSALDRRIGGSKHLLEYKAVIYRIGWKPEEKVGAIGSGSTIGQSIQGVASIALPGDISEVRSPVRSRLYSALIPGGGGRILPRVPGVVKPERGYRCPEGFQFGGRFTDNRYSTCGQMLFDLFTLGARIGAVADLPTARRTRLTQDVNVTPVRGPGLDERSMLISRAAQIPKVGAENKAKRSSGVSAVSDSILGTPSGTAVMVRRDGFLMKPVVSAAVLRTVPDNRNMEGAAYILSAQSPDLIGKDELGLLSNTGITTLQYVLPSGVKLKLEKTRPLSVGERRKLGRTVNEAASMDLNTDPAARLKAVAAESGGGISYSEDLGSIDKPNDLITPSGSKTPVRRWVYESFTKKSPKAQRVEKEPAKETATDDSKLTDKITALKDAVDHLDNNGDPNDVAPNILLPAMAKTGAFATNKLSNGVTIHERSDGKAFYEIASKSSFEHLGARVSSDIQSALGLKAPSVTFVGEGTRRPYLLAHPRNAVGNRGVQGGVSLSKVDPDEMIKLAASDWLTDVRDRNPANMVAVRQGETNSVTATSNRLAGLAGLSTSEISQRQKLGLDKMFTDARRGVYGSAFKELSASQQKMIVNQLDEIISRAAGFNWDEYISRLMIDGKLSGAEKAHLNAIRAVYDQRLETLRTSKSQFLKNVGVQ